MTKRQYWLKLKKAAVDGTFPSTKNQICQYIYVDGEGKEHRCAAGILLKPGDNPEEGCDLTFCENKELFSKRLPKGMALEELMSVQYCHDQHACNWIADKFIDSINSLACFKEFQK